MAMAPTLAAAAKRHGVEDASALAEGGSVDGEGYFDETDADEDVLIRDGRDKVEVENIAMRIAMEHESSIGYIPKDVSADNCGYDIESTPTKASQKVRRIEVKGRVKGSSTVTVTRNEIRTGLGDAEFWLAIVEVEGNQGDLTFVRSPFECVPDKEAISVNYDIGRLKRKTRVVVSR